MRGVKHLLMYNHFGILLLFPRFEHKIDVDFGQVYGKKFSLLNEMVPASVMLAEGSEITVEGKRTIRK